MADGTRLLIAAMTVGAGVLSTSCRSETPRSAVAETRSATLAEAPAPFAASAARVARGEYLARGVAMCLNCHSELDRSVRPAKILPGRLGTGSALGRNTFRPVAPNLTPDRETGSGGWTDEQWTRAIRQGIGHDGRTLFSLMPYEYYNQMSDEDLASIVVYFRSLPPVVSEVRPVPVPPQIAATLKPLSSPGTVPAPADDQVARGRYLVQIGHCAECHTPMRDGRLIPAMRFSGGRMFQTADLTSTRMLASSNLTPDASGIPYYDADVFIKTMRTGSVNGVRELDNMMPWSFVRNVSDADLKDMFAYLRSLQPIAHRVDNREAPTRCPIDGALHGLGDQNHAVSAGS